MPKERRERSVSLDRRRVSPFPCSSSRSRESLPKNPLESEENVREWEDARCPVCMEHPHNAILLICTSHEKGCRPFMCDTSYRHSNCFDQFRKSFGEGPQEDVAVSEPISQQENVAVSESLLTPEPLISEAIADLPGQRGGEGATTVHDVSCESSVKPKLLCPLCRGLINGWIVVESARHFMNGKTRSCACETCDFSGTYTDLRKHARAVHPLARPTETDPERQRNWRRLERQRDIGDLLSTLNSSIGEDRMDDGALTLDEGWLTVFFLVRIFRPGRARVTFRRGTARRHWGEAYNGDTDSRDEDNESSDGGSARQVHHGRTRRRPTPES